MSDSTDKNLLDSNSEPSTPKTDETRRNLLTGGAAALAGLALSGLAQAQTMIPTAAPTGRANPQSRFAGKVVLITGATSGIGETTAREFAREGAIVHFCGRRANLGAQVQAAIREFGGRASFQQTDVRDAAQVRRFVETAVQQYGRVDIAFNNAGIFMQPRELQDLTLENFNDMIQTNLNGVAYGMYYQIPVMRRQGRGVIINMASVASHSGFANTPHYNASKHGVLGLTRAVARANAGRNIRVNSISPLAVDTPMLRESFAFQNVTYEQMAPNFVTPRIMTTLEMARAVMFLADDSSTMITGMDLDVTGGQLA